MPTKKIADLPGLCTHPDHNPPMHQVFEPGIYEHECPSCHEKTKFIVQGFFGREYRPLEPILPLWLEHSTMDRMVPGSNPGSCIIS